MLRLDDELAPPGKPDQRTTSAPSSLRATPARSSSFTSQAASASASRPKLAPRTPATISRPGQTPAPALFSGDIAGLGGAEKPIDANRNINAFFGELSVPIVKNLDGGVALRWDDYSDFGGATTALCSLKWEALQ